MPSTKIDSSNISIEMAGRWNAASKKSGGSFLISKEERFSISEYERAMHVLCVWKREGEKGNPARTLRTYGVIESVILEIIADWCDMTITEEDLIEIGKTEKRSDKYDSFIDWTKDKVGEQFTTETLVEVAGFSYVTVLKFLDESQYFKKIKKGLWEVRDPKAEREAGI